MASFQKKILLWTLIVTAAHTAGSLWFYDATDWFDNFVHFLGGIWLVFAITLFRRNFSSFETVFIVLVAAVLWENFEGILNWYATAAYGFVTPVGGGLIDTASDVGLGVVGAIIAAYFFRRRD